LPRIAWLHVSAVVRTDECPRRAETVARSTPSASRRLPEHLRPAIEKCLRKDPRTRCRDIRDARTALLEAKAEPSANRKRPATIPWTIAAALATTLVAVSSFFVPRLRILPSRWNFRSPYP
jgi:hypothetical protein